MRERITVRPVWLENAGWVLYLRPQKGSASPPCYWGGDGKPTPQEALEAYAAPAAKALPSFDLVFKPPTRAQLNRAHY